MAPSSVPAWLYVGPVACVDEHPDLAWVAARVDLPDLRQHPVLEAWHPSKLTERARELALAQSARPAEVHSLLLRSHMI